MHCDHDNQPNAKFCSECGAPLAIQCPGCQAVQPAGSKFCNQCGTALGASASAAHTTPTAAASLSAVRKQVTALFADLVGSTSFGEQVDPETARAAMAGYFELLRSTIEDHAGTVVKFMGDGVLAVFGIPEVAEDDALRAVAAGNELQQHFRSFADTIRERHGIELGLRVGANTGELVIGADDADLVGDVLNTAARLEAACQPGRVLVGEDTWRLTRSSVAYEVLGEIRVKGKAEPIATFQVVSDIDRAIDEVTPFVGRQDELAGLQAVFAEACDNGTARLVTVIGAPGVGKTRLAAELRAASEARSFDLRFERRGSTTFTPIADLLRELTGTGSVDDVARLVADHPEATRLADILSALLGHGDAPSTEESFWAVRRLLELLTRDEPVIMVVDDIQWAEPLFWDLLDHLVEWTVAPVMIVALARPELRELKPELAQVGKRVSMAVALEGLDASTTRELAARLLDTDELPGDLIDRLPESTQGNPLFVRELVQMLVDDGVLARVGDRWRLTIDVDAIEVPPTILSLLASRVERLPDDERQVVELASVIGTEFDRGALTALAGADIASRLGALIDRLRRKDLIEPSGSWAGDHPVYRFHHVLIRDAAYRRLLKAHRADLHERVGLHLESAVASTELDVVIAHHYEQVHAYRSDLGTLDDSTRLLAAQASMRLKTAAELALAREDLSSSGGYAMRALALTNDRGERDALLVLGCEALLSSGDVARGAPLVEELAGRTVDDRLSAWADCFRAQLWSLTDSDRLSEASELADAAAGRLEGLDDQAGVAKARLVRASTLARLGRVGDCEAELDLALGAARAAGDRRRTVAVLGAAPLAALWGPSPVARAGGRCLDVLRLLRITTSSPAVEATSIRCQGMLEALRGRFDSAREKFETSRTTARDLGLRHGLYETELFEGFVELIAGDPVAAEPHLVLARDGLGALGIGADAGQASALLARALLRQGRIDEADVLASAALEAAGENLQTAVASRSVLGEIRVEQGRHDEARQLIAAALEIVERTDITIDHAIAQRSAARVADRLGNADEARAHRVAAERLLADKGVTGLAETRSERAVGDTSEQGHTADDGETRRAAMLPPNAAWEVNEGLWSTWIVGDQAGYLQLLAPDFQARIHELGPKLAFSGDRYATAEVLFESLVDDRIHAIPNRLIAKRGDDLALIAMTFQDGASSTTMYTVSQVRDGRAVRADTFAEDQLGDALDELDRQWIELGGSRVISACWAQWRRALEPGNVDQLALLLTDDFIDVDHRDLCKGSRRRDEYIDTYGSLATAHAIVIPAEIVEWSQHVALSRVSMIVTDSGAAWDMWALTVYRGGLVQRNENFGIDAFDAARARYDELSGESPSARTSGRGHPVTANRSSRAVDAVARATNAGDFDGLATLLHPEYRMTFRFRFADPQEPLDRAQLIHNLATMSDQGVNLTNELVAVRGDDLCLSHVNIAGPTGVSERYVVNRTLAAQTSGDGLSIEGISFDGDQLDEALDELDRQWVELGGPARLVELQQQLRTANRSGDADLLRGGLLPGWTFHDRRQLGIGAMTRGEYISSSFANRGGVTIVIVEYLDWTGSAAMTRDRFINPDGSEWEHLAVITYEPGGFRSADLFSLDDLDAARSHFDELTDAGEEPDQHQATVISRDDPGRLDAGTISNTAWVISQQIAEALDRWDREAFVGLLSEHLESIDHERLSLALGATRNRDEYVAIMFDQHDDLLAGSTTTARPVAIRDDDLCLVATTRTTDGYVIERLVVVETRDGQAIRFDWFDADDLVGALDELDRRWVARGGPAEEIRLAIAWRNAQHTGDIEAARHVLSPDFVMTDHRRLGVGRLGVDDHLTTAVRGASGVVGIPVEYVAHTDSAALARIRITAPDESEWEQWVVTSVGGGLTRSVDLFDPDDLVVARARFEELASDADPEQSAFSNHAWEVARAFGNALVARDRTTAAGLLADTFESTTRERFDVGARLDREMFLDAMFDTYLADGDVEVVQRLRAIRGDTWCVWQMSATFGSGAVVERVCVSSARGGQIESTTWYEVAELHDAMDQLDRRWTASGGRADPVVAAVARSMSNGPFDAYADCFAPDFVCVDHRELGFGVRLRDQWLETTDPLVDQVTDLVQEYLAVGDGISLSRIEMSSNIDGSVWPFWLIDQHDGERAVRWEEFAIDQRSRALARYHDLTATAVSVPRTPTNAATRLIDDYTAALNDRDLDRFVAAFHPDIHQELHQRIRVADVVDADGLVGLGRAIIAGNPVLSSETLAIFGDHLAVCTQILRFGPDEVRECSVVEVDGGLITRLVSFDDDQLIEALDTFARRSIELGRPAAPAELEITIRGAHWRHDVDAFEQALDPSWTFHDHRRLGLGSMTLEQYLASSFPPGPGQVIYWTVEILAEADSVALAHDRWLVADGSAWDQLHVRVVRQGLALSSETFDLDDLDAARARYDELVGDDENIVYHDSEVREGRFSRPVEFGESQLVDAQGFLGERWAGSATQPLRLANRATRLNDLLVRASTGGDRARYADLLADDFASITHEQLRITQDQIPDRDTFVKQTFDVVAAASHVVVGSDVVAIRGDDLCLVRIDARFDEGNIYRYVVVEAAGDRIGATEWFDLDDLENALDVLDQRWIELGGSANLVSMLREVRHTLGRGSSGELRELISDDFTSTDRRQLGMGTRTADQWVDSLTSATGTTDFVVHEVIAHTERAICGYISMYVRVDGALWEALWISEIDEQGHATRWDLFDVDDLDGATARFRELAEGPDPTVVAQEFTNEAWMLGEACAEALSAGDHGRLLELLHEDFESETRERFGVGETLDREAWTRIMLDLLESVTDISAQRNLLAVRGDSLCLSRFDSSLDGNEIDRLVVLRTDSGRILQRRVFDVDQLMDALDELDRQWAEHGGPARVLEHTVALRRAIHDGDTDAARAVLSPVFQATDHRRLGLPTLDRAGYLAAPKGGSGTQLLVVDVVRHADDATLEQIQVNLEDGWSTMEMWAVVSLDEHGIATMDNYDIDDADAARARFHELTSMSAPDVPEVTNPGSEAWAAGAEAWRNGSLSAMRPWLHPDFRFEARRASIPSIGGDRDDYLSALSMFEDEGVADLTMEVIAIRGDRLALCEFVITTSAGDEFRLLNVGESADDGTAIRMTTFDTHQLDEALDELDRQWVESGGPGVAATRVRQVSKTLSTGSQAEFAALFGVGFECVDHRPLGLGTRDRDEFLASIEPLVGNVNAWTAKVFEADDRATLTRVEMRSTESDMAWSLLLLTTYDDDLVDRWEQFATDDYPTAKARFDELVAQHRNP